MSRADIEPATFGCHTDVVASGVARIRITGRVDAAAASELGATLRAVQEAAAVTMLDVRAASMTPALLELIESADGRAREDGCRLVILERPAPGAQSELVALGLTAKLITITDADLDTGAAFRPPIALAGSGERVVVDVQGALDMTIGPELDAELAAHAALGRAVVLDLRAVDCMDATGVRILIDAVTRARERGLGFELLAGDAVNRTLAIAGVRQQLDPLAAVAHEQP